MTSSGGPAPLRGRRAVDAGHALRAVRAVLAVTALSAVAGCAAGETASTTSGSTTTASTTTGSTTSESTTPGPTTTRPTTNAGGTTQTATCADRATPVPVPAEFPADFPLPPRTVVTSVERRSGDRLVLTGVSPDGFRTVLRHLQTALPEAGLRLSGGEVEEQDAESDYSGPRYVGRWTLRVVPGCDADTLVTVLVARR